MNRLRTGSWSVVFDLALLLTLVAAFYWVRLPDLTIRGEESRRASIAQEMLRTGDWLIPRQQGQPFLSRPPLHNWLIALASMARGEFDLIAVRVPTMAALLGTVLLVYAYGRSLVSRLAGLTAALAVLSMPEILQMGRVAECDMLFTFLLSSALLIWHWGWVRAWPKPATWLASFALLVLATLTKGPQASIVFGLSIALFLLLTRQWQALFSRAFAMGLLAYSFLLGAWLLPCYLTLGQAQTIRLVFGDTTDRFHGWKLAEVVLHWLRYPWEAIGCTVPWSFLLLAFLSRQFRATLANARSHALFLALGATVGFLPCWVTPGGQTRYLMPIYPCVAVLAGLVVDRLAVVDLPLWLSRYFGIAYRVLTLDLLVVAAVVGWLAWGPVPASLWYWKQPTGLAAVAIAAAVIGAVFQWRNGPFRPGRVRWNGLIALALFLGLFYSGPVLNNLAAQNTHAECQAQQWKQQLPAGARVVSLGPVHHKFLYLAGRSIPIVSESEVNRIPAGSYLCYDSWNETRKSFPFPSEEIAVVNMDRVQAEHPQLQVIVVRRTGASESGPQLAKK